VSIERQSLGIYKTNIKAANLHYDISTIRYTILSLSLVSVLYNPSTSNYSIMAAQEKNPVELEKASKLANVPRCEQYERMISGMLLVKE